MYSTTRTSLFFGSSWTFLNLALILSLSSPLVLPRAVLPLLLFQTVQRCCYKLAGCHVAHCSHQYGGADIDLCIGKGMVRHSTRNQDSAQVTVYSSIVALSDYRVSRRRRLLMETADSSRRQRHTWAGVLR